MIIRRKVGGERLSSSRIRALANVLRKGRGARPAQPYFVPLQALSYAEVIQEGEDEDEWIDETCLDVAIV